MIEYVMMIMALMGLQSEVERPSTLSVHLTKGETIELFKLVEKADNPKLVIDIISDHIKSIYYDHETQDSTIVFKNPEKNC